MVRAILDTNIFVAALRSKQGASFRLVQMLGAEARYRLMLSVPLVLEYEVALKRKTSLTPPQVEELVDYVCQMGEHREIHFLWRPFLRDPRDEMVLEVAVESEADFIVTHNVRDFAEVEARFGIRVVRPGAFLLELEERAL